MWGLLTLTNEQIKNLNIPLIIRGDRVGIIEIIMLKTMDGFPKIFISGTLIKELKNPDALVELLKVEGINLGKS